MDVNNIAGLAVAMTQQRNSSEVALTVFKKALNIQSSAALSLIDAIPTASLPAHLGNTINTKV